MAELITLARPYAKAAFEHALAADQLTAWSEALADAAAVTVEPRIAILLASPGLTSTQKAEALISVCGEELPQSTANFIRVLAENRRLPLLPQVHQLFLAFKANQERAVDLEVVSAFEISDDQAARLAGVMGEKLRRQVRVSTSVDKTLIGGVVMRAADLVIDGSVRGRLAKLSEAMNS
ncbi:MAG: F0F1 ATP synthase subunit delta [Gammaproteobacteria bacterium]|jgi:F-type H+-transporting ATPase subunit delta|nr:F0F1 ATP synthase subunit delta [Gammaproteobacteria bacterium]MBP6051870.1 F0F1 ATP synthase subunit delta [Pseudomonadales bacterium]MBK6582906.1 F0F1 ATP synthase subunit delta [Gammaproteobacteria bacterium]MBK7168205.1 F0F1 ATP synthase subunit delta [Gammaproteobacteria bacterium]MBK7519036.1 F0F1 ATP synthase subunit delta [Gammaproteobacteria bacterium]